MKESSVLESCRHAFQALCERVSHDGRSPLMSIDLLLADLQTGLHVTQEDVTDGRLAVERLKAIFDQFSSAAVGLQKDSGSNASFSSVASALKGVADSLGAVSHINALK